MKRREFLWALAIGTSANWLAAKKQNGGGKKMSQRSIVVDTTRSPHAILRPIPISEVKLRDRFWQPRLIDLQEITLPTQYEIMEETGRIDNFRYASGKIKSSQGLRFLAPDSDVYKWVEAAAWSLAVNPNPKVSKLMNAVVEEIVAAQDEDGYIHTFFTFDRKKERWTNLRDMHELYCAGHLFQAAVAHHRVTGEDKLLKATTRFADLIDRVFGWGKKEESDGHPEIEMALVELYRETGERRYLELAKFFLDVRGQGRIGGSHYIQDHKPFRELEEITGHAVRALYLNAGASDLYAETGDKTLISALEKMWRNLTGRRIYVTGGCGSRYEGEAFGRDYELPNERAYAETCAAIANILWQWRMFLLIGEARFFDSLERSLFNGALSGIGLDGKSYFYVNPLADRGHHRRQPYFECACCPPNIARLLPMVPSFLYAVSDNGFFVNLYAESTASLSFKGVPVTFVQRTNYPWDGEIELQVQPEKTVNFALNLRVPSWCPKATVKVNSQTIDAEPGTFVTVQRDWKRSDLVHLSLEMPSEFVVCHPFVEPNGGRIAIQRGPIVYCLEQVDNTEADVWCVAARTERPLTAFPKVIANLPVIAIQGEGFGVELRHWEKDLYRPLRAVRQNIRPILFVAIPYFAWANRDAGPMTVWLTRG
ncbi:MAG: glycoside hydrolase family 127 protein [Armatimonadetes bacterium]|nr:glycoside hydrolase family 127 protein [Armatimonadota bacterium]MDW8027576.1 glycoside hydrolase family 127 protein [Armatimonadota bacterium]